MIKGIIWAVIFMMVLTGLYACGGEIGSSNPAFLDNTSFSISGTVVTSSGSSLQSVIIKLGGSGSGSAYTDATGSFSFVSLANKSTYSITPSRTGYTFDPASAELTIDNSNINSVLFVASHT